MSYRLLCIDIDGTLINSEHKISEETKKAIREVREQGVIVTLVTGRRYVSTLPYAKELQLDLPIICFNGGLVVDATSGDPFHMELLEQEYAMKIIDAWHELAVPIFAYRHSLTPPDVYHQNMSDHFRVQKYLEFEKTNMNILTVDRLSEHMQWSPLRLTTFGHSKSVERCYNHYQDLYKRDDVRVLLTSDYDTARFLEVYPANATKANGLRWLSEYYQIPKQQIVAIGDNLNDTDMLEWAGIGVAMGNALDEVKEVADVVTEDRDNDGVANAIREIWRR